MTIRKRYVGANQAEWEACIQADLLTKNKDGGDHKNVVQVSLSKVPPSAPEDVTHTRQYSVVLQKQGDVKTMLCVPSNVFGTPCSLSNTYYLTPPTPAQPSPLFFPYGFSFKTVNDVISHNNNTTTYKPIGDVISRIGPTAPSIDRYHPKITFPQAWRDEQGQVVSWRKENVLNAFDLLRYRLGVSVGFAPLPMYFTSQTKDTILTLSYSTVEYLDNDNLTNGSPTPRKLKLWTCAKVRWTNSSPGQQMMTRVYLSHWYKHPVTGDLTLKTNVAVSGEELWDRWPLCADRTGKKFITIPYTTLSADGDYDASRELGVLDQTIDQREMICTASLSGGVFTLNVSFVQSTVSNPAPFNQPYDSGDTASSKTHRKALLFYFDMNNNHQIVYSEEIIAFTGSTSSSGTLEGGGITTTSTGSQTRNFSIRDTGVEGSIFSDDTYTKSNSSRAIYRQYTTDPQTGHADDISTFQENLDLDERTYNLLDFNVDSKAFVLTRLRNTLTFSTSSSLTLLELFSESPVASSSMNASETKVQAFSVFTEMEASPLVVSQVSDSGTYSLSSGDIAMDVSGMEHRRLETPYNHEVVGRATVIKPNHINAGFRLNTPKFSLVSLTQRLSVYTGGCFSSGLCDFSTRPDLFFPINTVVDTFAYSKKLVPGANQAPPTVTDYDAGLFMAESHGFVGDQYFLKDLFSEYDFFSHEFLR